MYDFSIVSTILYTILFAFAAVVAFYIPGSVLLKRYSLRITLHMPLALTLGISLWALQGFLFGYLSVRWLTYAYLLIFCLLFIKQVRLQSLSKVGTLLKEAYISNKMIIWLITAGVIIQLTTILFTMIPTTGGLFFCCGDSNDNTWFAAVTNQLIHTMPPQQPGMTGVSLNNYHFLSNLVVADLSRVFHIPFLLVQYQYVPILLSVLYGVLAVVFGRLLGLSSIFIGWLVFFLYFGSDAISVMLFFLGKGFNFSMSSLEDGVRFLANLPRAYAMVVAFGFVDLFVVWLRRRELYGSVLLGLIAASLVGFKVYVGIFVFVGMGVFALYEMLKHRDIRPMWTVLAGVFVAAGVYLPINSEAGGLYFTGLWRFENFIVQPGLDLLHLEQARVIYAEHGNWIHVAINEFIYIALYVCSIFGSKLMGLFQTGNSMRLFPTPLHLFLLSGMAVSTIAGLFFNQTIGSSNTFNFLVSVFIFLSFYSALTMAYVVGRLSTVVRNVLIMVVIVITIPRIIYETSRNVGNLIHGNYTIVSKPTIEGARYLKAHSNTKDIVAIDNRDFFYDVNAPMFSILVDRPMFLSGVGLLKHFGVDTQEREKIVDQIFTNPDKATVAKMLIETGIDYLVSSSQTPPTSTQSAIFLPISYENQDVVIRKVDVGIATTTYKEAQSQQSLPQLRK